MKVLNKEQIIGHGCSWNYRVLREDRSAEGYDKFRIIEVHYSDSGEIEGWCESSGPQGDGYEELREDLDHMRDAIEQPLLMRGKKDRLFLYAEYAR